MSTASRDTQYDLFVSYAHKDNQEQHVGRVTELVERIKRQFQKIVGRPLRVFFDLAEIHTMQDWYGRIQSGLVQSRMMVAILSPRYFASEFCRHEWAEFVETELAHALPGEGIAPIYVIPHPDFETASTSDDRQSQVDRWVRDLKKRQYLHLLATTRLPANPQNQMTLLRVDALHPDDAEARQFWRLQPRTTSSTSSMISVCIMSLCSLNK